MTLGEARKLKEDDYPWFEPGDGRRGRYLFIRKIVLGDGEFIITEYDRTIVIVKPSQLSDVPPYLSRTMGSSIVVDSESEM